MHKLYTTVLMAALLCLGTDATAAERVAVPVLKETVRSGDLITADRLETRMLPRHQLPGTVVLDDKVLIGMEATRILRAGTPVYHGQVRVAPDVRRSAEVMVVYNMPGMFLSTYGEALEDALIGEHVKVRNLSSGKIISGKVVAANRIEVGTR